MMRTGRLSDCSKMKFRLTPFRFHGSILAIFPDPRNEPRRWIVLLFCRDSREEAHHASLQRPARRSRPTNQISEDERSMSWNVCGPAAIAIFLALSMPIRESAGRPGRELPLRNHRLSVETFGCPSGSRPDTRSGTQRPAAESQIHDAVRVTV